LQGQVAVHALAGPDDLQVGVENLSVIIEVDFPKVYIAKRRSGLDLLSGPVALYTHLEQYIFRTEIIDQQGFEY